jgi:hypothetical protein
MEEVRDEWQAQKYLCESYCKITVWLALEMGILGMQHWARHYLVACKGTMEIKSNSCSILRYMPTQSEKNNDNHSYKSW